MHRCLWDAHKSASVNGEILIHRVYNLRDGICLWAAGRFMGVSYWPSAYGKA